MKSFRRLSQSITASFQWMVNHIENHEGLVNAAIAEVQEAGTRAHIQLKRVKNDGLAMRKKLIELQEQKSLWEDRAKKVVALDDSKALECMKRRKRVERDIALLEEQERAHAQVEHQLIQDLSHIQERLLKLKQQRNVMRTRQSRAEALNVLQSEDTTTLTEIDEIFERWDHKISEYEGFPSPGTPEDALVEEFTTIEESEELRKELSTLLNKQ